MKPGRIMFELEGLPPAGAMEAMRLAAFKLPIKTKFVVREEKTNEKPREENLMKAMTPSRAAGSLEESLRKRDFRLQFRHTSNPLKNPMQIRMKRREVARLKTWLRQKEAGAS